MWNSLTRVGRKSVNYFRWRDFPESWAQKWADYKLQTHCLTLAKVTFVLVHPRASQFSSYCSLPMSSKSLKQRQSRKHGFFHVFLISHHFSIMPTHTKKAFYHVVSKLNACYRHVVWNIKKELERLLSFTILTKKLFREIMNKLVKMQTTLIFSDWEINNCS